MWMWCVCFDRNTPWPLLFLALFLPPFHRLPVYLWPSSLTGADSFDGKRKYFLNRTGQQHLFLQLSYFITVIINLLTLRFFPPVNNNNNNTQSCSPLRMVVELVGWLSVGVWGHSLHRHLIGLRKDQVHYGPAVPQRTVRDYFSLLHFHILGFTLNFWRN